MTCGNVTGTEHVWGEWRFVPGSDTECVRPCIYCDEPQFATPRATLAALRRDGRTRKALRREKEYRIAANASAEAVGSRPAFPKEW